MTISSKSSCIKSDLKDSYHRDGILFLNYNIFNRKKIKNNFFFLYNLFNLDNELKDKLDKRNENFDSELS